MGVYQSGHSWYLPGLSKAISFFLAVKKKKETIRVIINFPATPFSSIIALPLHRLIFQISWALKLQATILSRYLNKVIIGCFCTFSFALSGDDLFIVSPDHRIVDNRLLQFGRINLAPLCINNLSSRLYYQRVRQSTRPFWVDGFDQFIFVIHAKQIIFIRSLLAL